jgi:hypothetical protein
LQLQARGLDGLQVSGQLRGQLSGVAFAIFLELFFLLD